MEKYILIKIIKVILKKEYNKFHEKDSITNYSNHNDVVIYFNNSPLPQVVRVLVSINPKIIHHPILRDLLLKYFDMDFYKYCKVNRIKVRVGLINLTHPVVAGIYCALHEDDKYDEYHQNCLGNYT
jgi:hypothetical protein